MRKYNKLVRDKIPDIITATGNPVIFHIAENQDIKGLLKDKLREEVEEFCFSKSPEELADIQEVIRAICTHYGYGLEQVENLRTDKLEKRGGFEKWIVLDES